MPRNFSTEDIIKPPMRHVRGIDGKPVVAGSENTNLCHSAAIRC